ncbi:hypothetical protein BH09CHL1_BH09CHL1_30940 [soil metagenome]
MQRSTYSSNRPGAMKRLAVSFAVLSAIGLSAASAIAQDEPDIKSYIAENYDFSIEWDRNLWNSSSTYTFGDQEGATLSTGTTTVELIAQPAEARSVDECIDDAVSAIESTPEYLSAEIVNDIETPGDANDEGVTLTYGELLDGRETPVDMAVYVTCAPVDEDGMLVITVTTRLGIWGEEIEIVDALLDTLETGS